MTSAKFAEIVMGPAGSGKSTFIRRMMEHFELHRRNVHAVNLDPAADGPLPYPATIDVREMYSVKEAMEDHGFGPNGGLIYCMEQIVSDFDWFDSELGDHEYDFLLFDLPGQIELFNHLDVLPRLLSHLESREYHLCGVFLIDSQFMCDPSKYLSGCLSVLSAMTMIAIPYVNVLSKCDLLSEDQKERLDAFVEMDTIEVGGQIHSGEKLHKLTEKICTLIKQYNMIDFFPFDQTESEDVTTLIGKIDQVLQFEDYADYIEAEFDLGGEEKDDLEKTLKDDD